MMEGSIQPPTIDAEATAAATTPTGATTATVTPISTATAAATDTPTHTPAVVAAATTDTPRSAATTADATSSPIFTATAPAATSSPAPAVDAAVAAATTDAPLYSASVLLEEEAYYDDCENDTTAEAMTCTNKVVKVTFILADPPAVSYFCVHGPELKHADFLLVPRVVFSEKDLVLLRFEFTLRPDSTVREPHPPQYFVYKAAHGQPSLRPIPTTLQPDSNIASYPSVLPFEDEDDNFLVADLAITRTPGHYVLHIFSSKTNKWITTPLQLQASLPTTEDLPSLPHKVIALGADTIGWIDLWRGIVVCNVFAEDPTLHFIPLPMPEFNLHLRGDPQQIRDVTFCNGFIKFIEMEHWARPPSLSSENKRNFKTTKDLDTAGILYDLDLIFHSRADLMKKPPPLPVSWKIRTCSRHTSWNFWCKGHSVDVDDILVKNPSYYMMLPELWDVSAGKFTLSNLTTVCPTLSIHGGDLVYLVSKVGAYDENAWVVGVDLGKKTVEVLEPYSAARSSLHQTPFLACTFSGYLNKTASSCPPEDGCGQNCPLNGYIGLGNNPIMGGYSRSYSEHSNDVHPVNSYPFQPRLVIPPHSFPQTRQHNFAPSGSGYVGPASAQLTYPVLNTDAHAQQWLSMPMDNCFQLQMPQELVSPAVPFNTLKPRVLMDDRVLSQIPQVPAYPAVPSERLMHVWMRAPTSEPFNEPESLLSTATAANTLVNSN